MTFEEACLIAQMPVSERPRRLQSTDEVGAIALGGNGLHHSPTEQERLDQMLAKSSIKTNPNDNPKPLQRGRWHNHRRI